MWRVVVLLCKKGSAPSFSSSSGGGLFGIPNLATSKGFEQFADKAMERCGELVSSIAKNPKPSLTEVIRLADDISYTVYPVLCASHLCEAVHPDSHLRDEATKTLGTIIEYNEYLRNVMYDLLKKAEQECDQLSEEAQWRLRRLRMSEEAGLCSEKLKRVKELNFIIDDLSTGYYRNIIKASRFSMPFSSNEEPRKKAYVDAYLAAHANVDILKRLVRARHELAQIMGCTTYAEFTVKYNVALSPKAIVSFLIELSGIVQRNAKEKLELLTNYKRKDCGDSGTDFRPWDVEYYFMMMADISSRTKILDYLSLSNCIEGLKMVVLALFGATLQSIPLAAGESWHPQVFKMALHHHEEGDLGYMYMDLHSREAKHRGCAVYTVREGRRISETEYELPVVALVCDFPPDALKINPLQLRSLFHEFGHVLHILLARTEHSHLSSTIRLRDFIELPSILFEHYASDYRVLKRFARHHSTGEELPKATFESAKDAFHVASILELQEEIFGALVDQAVHGEHPPGDISSVVAELQKEHLYWKYVEEIHWETNFYHLLPYGAAYYGYLYCRCFAATVWKLVCDEDPLSPATGAILRTKLFQYGGSKDPIAILNDLAGDGIYKYRDGGIVPDVSTLCKEYKFTKE